MFVTCGRFRFTSPFKIFTLSGYQMKKRILVLLLLFAMPVLVHSVTDEDIVIKKLLMKPIPFNERRNPAADSPYNAFDGDFKSAALYSDFSMELSKPVTIDTIKIMNGNTSSKEMFKKDNRIRDIEITLYTQEIKTDKKVPVKKNKKTVPAKRADKKRQTELNKDDSKNKPGKEKVKNDKTGDEKKEIKEKENKADKNDKEKEEKNEKEKKEDIEKNKKEEKTIVPEKVVNYDVFESPEIYDSEDIKLFFTATEAVSEPEKNTTTEIKTDKKESDGKQIKDRKQEKKITKKSKKKEKKLSGDKPVEKKSGSQKNDTVKSSSNKQSTQKETIPVKTKTGNTNIIEITDSNKSKQPSVPGKSETIINKSHKPEEENEVSEETKIKKILAGEDKTEKTSDKKSLADNKKTEKNKTGYKMTKKPVLKSDKKKTEKDFSKKKPVTGVKKKESSITKKPDVKNSVKIDKPISSDSQIKKDNKTAKPVNEKKENEKITDKIITEKKDDKKNDNIKGKNKKTAADSAKNDKKNNKEKKNSKKVITDKKKTEDVTVKKMSGVVRIENDNTGRVLIYTTLKDSMDFQSINLKGKYVVTKIDFRTRDDEYYKGIEQDRTSVAEIAFFNNGKRIPFQGIDSMKKTYMEKYSKSLSGSISGETFIMYEKNETILRMTFKKDGNIEFHDRYKCRKNGDADCTSVVMPDKWKITDGILYMRFNTIPFLKDNMFWRIWKYELDSQDDILNNSDFIEPPRWMKLYFKTDKGFADKYLDLIRSESSLWTD